MRFLKAGIKAAGAVALALFMLSGVTWFYKYTPARVVHAGEETDYSWEPFGRMHTMEEGFAWLRMDGSGYNNAHAKADPAKVDILLMGSSHIQGAEVKSTENAGYLLNEMLPDWGTYNIGISSHHIHTCISNLGAAIRKYDPEKFIVIETDTVRLSRRRMEKVTAGKYPEIRSRTGRWINLVQSVFPSVKKLAIQLEAWEAADEGGNFLPDGAQKNAESTDEIKNEAPGENEAAPRKDIPSAKYRKSLRKYLAKAAETLEENNCKAQLIIVFQPETVLNPDGSYADQGDEAYIDAFARACEENEVIFIDMTPDFRQLYEEQHILPHGFANTSVGIGHLNRHGHKMLAQRISQQISEQGDRR